MAASATSTTATPERASSTNRASRESGDRGPEDARFAREIERLADGAVAEVRRGRRAVRRASRRRISALLWTGAVLILAELASLAVQIEISRTQVSAGGPRTPSRLISKGDCRGAMYNTYRAIVDYVRDHRHPPATLGELAGRYAERRPADPQTGKSLLYTTDGRRFTLSCP